MGVIASDSQLLQYIIFDTYILKFSPLLKLLVNLIDGYVSESYWQVVVDDSIEWYGDGANSAIIIMGPGHAVSLTQMMCRDEQQLLEV